MNSVTRRTFLSLPLTFPAAQAQSAEPWYRHAIRWGQTNITELDPVQYDIDWWRQHWKRTAVQGVIINAGGIVAYYPSKYDLHYRAQFLHGRDLYGELAEAAHKDGLVVLARMDSNRASEAFYKKYPDWFAVDRQGRPIRAEDKFVTCVNGPYYDEWIPNILREIIERSKPEGLTDNSWAGLGRERICYCANCARRFQQHAGKPLPERADWDDPVYRQWILWSYQRRTEIWEINNRTSQSAGGPHCRWIGMNSGSISSMARSFRDLKAIAERADFLLLDHQARNDNSGFQQNADTGKLVHGVLGWDKLMPESMAMYQGGRPYFRVASKPAAESRMWMITGFAGGIQPWWHHVGAYHEDRRMYRTAEPLMLWHRDHTQFLINRQPAASVGVVWSQRNADFYGRSEPEEMVDLPYRGFTEALLRARIPYVPVNASHIDRDAQGLSVLVLPQMGALSDQEVAAIRRFVQRGGGVVASGPTGAYTETGERRAKLPFDELFGVRRESYAGEDRRWAREWHHSYIRLTPELRARVYGPKNGKEPAIASSASRHPVLAGFDETDILAFGGQMETLAALPDATVLATYIPVFPTYPPETAWMRTPKTDIPAITVREQGPARIAYLAADLDRRYAKDHLPDHAQLFANLVRWVSREPVPLEMSGPGLIDCHLYRQPGRVILHMVNLTNEAAWRSSIHEMLTVGPFRIRLRVGAGVNALPSRFLVSGNSFQPKLANGWAEFELPSITDHEVAVIG